MLSHLWNGLQHDLVIKEQMKTRRFDYHKQLQKNMLYRPEKWNLASSLLGIINPTGLLPASVMGARNPAWTTWAQWNILLSGSHLQKSISPEVLSLPSFLQASSCLLLLCFLWCIWSLILSLCVAFIKGAGIIANVLSKQKNSLVKFRKCVLVKWLFLMLKSELAFTPEDHWGQCYVCSYYKCCNLAYQNNEMKIPINSSLQSSLSGYVFLRYFLQLFLRKHQFWVPLT